MRPSLYTILLLSLASCDSQNSKIQQIHIRKSGYTSLDITLDRTGAGNYRHSDPPNEAHGSFTVTPQKFDEIRQRLEFAQRDAVPATDQSVVEMIRRGCPDGMQGVTDPAGIYIRWRTKTSSVHYLAQLGCDLDKNTGRNKKLLGVIESLPLPSKF